MLWSNVLIPWHGWKRRALHPGVHRCWQDYCCVLDLKTGSVPVAAGCRHGLDSAGAAWVFLSPTGI